MRSTTELWNRWYTPKQWRLWARSADDAIPRLKTTMVVESLVITNVLPRVQRRLAYIRGLRRIGRPQPLAGWQADFRADWKDMGRSDEHRLTEKELRCLKTPATLPISIDGHAPVTHISLVVSFSDLAFFRNLRRNHYPPYYAMEGIHFEKAVETPKEVDIHVLGRGLVTQSEPSHSSRPSSPTPSNLEEDDIDPDITEVETTSVAGEEERDDTDDSGDEEAVAAPGVLLRSSTTKPQTMF